MFSKKIGNKAPPYFPCQHYAAIAAPLKLTKRVVRWIVFRMDKSLSKEKCAHSEKLSPADKERYLQKYRDYINGIDPYSVKDTDWCLTWPEPASTCWLSEDTNFTMVPCVRGEQIHPWTIYTLEAHMQFTDGWVHNLHMVHVQETDNTIIKAKVSENIIVSAKVKTR